MKLYGRIEKSTMTYPPRYSARVFASIEENDPEHEFEADTGWEATPIAVKDYMDAMLTDEIEWSTLLYIGGTPQGRIYFEAGGCQIINHL